MLMLLAATILLQGCVVLQTVNAGVGLAGLFYAKETFEIRTEECDLMEPIYLDGDVEGLTDQDLKQIVIHNDKEKEFCK